MKPLRRWDAVYERVPHDRKIIGAEIGVWQGRMSAELLKMLPLLTLLLVDRWQVPPADDSYHQGATVMSKCSQLEFDAAMQKTLQAVSPYHDRVRIYKLLSIQAAAHIENGSLDFIFIDADHSYKGVLTDLQHWFPKLKGGGLCGGHDWENKNTTQDVARAVCDYFDCQPTDVELSYNNTWFMRR